MPSKRLARSKLKTARPTIVRGFPSTTVVRQISLKYEVCIGFQLELINSHSIFEDVEYKEKVVGSY